MKQEEQAVDVDGVDDNAKVQPDIQHSGLNGTAETDEDTLWADEELDGDVRGWKMKIIVELEDGDENV